MIKGQEDGCVGGKKGRKKAESAVEVNSNDVKEERKVIPCGPCSKVMNIYRTAVHIA